MKVNQWNRFLYAPVEDKPTSSGEPSAAVPKSAAAKDAQHAVANFDPGPMPDIDGILNGTVDPTAQPQPTPQSQPQSVPQGAPKIDPPVIEEAKDTDDPFAPIELPKPDDQKPTPVQEPPQEGTQVDPPATDNKGLRAQLDAANARLRQYESGEATQEIRSQLLAIQEENKKLQGHIHARDPHSHPEVIDLRREMQGKYAGVVRQMQIAGENPQFLASFLQTHLPELTSIQDQNSQPYLDKVGELRGILQEQGISRESIGAILNLADQGVDNSHRMAAKIKDINENWTTYEAKTAREEHERIAAEWAGVERTWINPTPDQLENDPYNPVVFMAKAMQGNDDLEKKLRATGKSLVSTFMPLAPVMPEDLQGKSEDEIANFLEDRVRGHSTRLRNFHGLVGNMAAFYRMGPGILRRLAEAEAALADYKGADPIPGGERRPGPSGAPQGAPNGNAQQDIKSFDPGPLPDIR